MRAYRTTPSRPSLPPNRSVVCKLDPSKGTDDDKEWRERYQLLRSRSLICHTDTYRGSRVLIQIPEHGKTKLGSQGVCRCVFWVTGEWEHAPHRDHTDNTLRLLQKRHIAEMDVYIFSGKAIPRITNRLRMGHEMTPVFHRETASGRKSRRRLPKRFQTPPDVLVGASAAVGSCSLSCIRAEGSQFHVSVVSFRRTSLTALEISIMERGKRS